MNFENTFEVDAPIDQVYDALLDVERVAPCVPGAQVLDRKSDDAYEVAIKVKVGPMSMLYKGTVEIVDRQPEQHSASMRAKARESRGQGNADAQVTMALTSENGKTRGTIDTDVKLSGKAAAMGGGVIKEVSGKLVDQFAREPRGDAGRGLPGHAADARGGRRGRAGDADRVRTQLGRARPPTRPRSRRPPPQRPPGPRRRAPRSRRPSPTRSTSGAWSAR